MIGLPRIKIILTYLALVLSSCFSLGAESPKVTAVVPHYGSAAGGEEVVIKGENLTNVTKVLFGAGEGEIIKVNDKQIIVRTPPHAPKTNHVRVVDDQGVTSKATRNDYFVFQGSLRGFSGAAVVEDVAPFDVETLGVLPFLEVGDVPSALISRADGTKVFSINKNGNSVSVIYPHLLKVAKTIDVGDTPFAGCLTLNGKYLFVGNQGDNSVSIINTNTESVVQTIALSAQPAMLSASPDGLWVLVTGDDGGSGTVSIINANSPFDVPVTLGVGANPQAVAFTSDGVKALVVNKGAGTVSLINMGTRVVDNTFTVGSSPSGIAITPNYATSYTIGSNGAPVIGEPGNLGQLAFVTNSGSDSVSVINLKDNTVSATISVDDNPEIVILTPDNSKAIVGCANNAGKVVFIDVATLVKEAGYVSYDNQKGLAVTPGGQNLFVSGGEGYLGKADLADLSTANVENPEIPLEKSVTFLPEEIVLLPDQAPLAKFNFKIKNDNKVKFNGSGSVSPYGTILFYIWDFGDGTVYKTPLSQVSYQYLAPGKYKPTLTVVNSAGTSLTKLFSFQSNPAAFTSHCQGGTFLRNGGATAKVAAKVSVKNLAGSGKRPAISSLSPTNGVEGTEVTITGKRFYQVEKVLFGGVEATSFEVKSDTSMTALVPNLGAEVKSVNVEVKNTFGTSKKNKNTKFDYQP